jgi:hypothetical protein
MILEQLIEKKDLLIYIDLRINELRGHINRINVTFEYNSELEDDNPIKFTKNTLKRLERNKRRLQAKIFELRKFKSVISENKLKSQSKIYWKHQNRKV